MSIRPLHDWAVIRPSGADEITAGGIIIPDTAKEKPHEGIVEAIGPGAYEEEKFGKKKVEKKDRRFIPTTVKPGDSVLYEKFAGQTYTVGGEELILVRERNILGILPERQPRQTPIPRPLQIPAVTSASGTTALMGSTVPVSKKRPAPKKKAAKKAATKKSVKPAKKAAKKATKKSVKKVAKPVSKAAKGRKASAKKKTKKKK
jgi:chaperonin GroES